MSAFHDTVLKPYEAFRRQLQHRFAGDPRGFLAADAKLRLRRGMCLTAEHEAILRAEAQEFIDAMGVKHE